MYKVIGGPRSRLTRVTWMLQELGEDYKIVPAKPRSEEILKYNPAGKGPVLVSTPWFKPPVFQTGQLQRE